MFVTVELLGIDIKRYLVWLGLLLSVAFIIQNAI